MADKRDFYINISHPILPNGCVLCTEKKRSIFSFNSI